MKKALITGAGKGIGAACARELVRSGWQVVINYNSSENAALALAEELNCTAIQADITDSDAVDKMFDNAGGIDLLVCNSGISMYKMFCDVTDEDYEKMFSVNFMGAVKCIRKALPYMISQKSGRIITVSSMWGQVGASCESTYSATKAALIGLTKSLAKELGPSGITVNSVAPGVIDTDMCAGLGEETKRGLVEETPVGRLGTPEDVARAVCFLAENSFITGQVIGVNGGFII